MAHPTTRRWAATMSVAAALLALGACGKSAPNDTNADPSGNPQFGGAASASADPSANPTSSDGGSGGGNSGGGGGGGGGATTTTERYPKDAKSYMQAFLVALSNNDKVRVAELAQDNPILIATNAASTYGKRNTSWTSPNCGGTNCQWRNAVGDDASVSIEPEKLGLPNAVYYLSFDPTLTPTDPYSYVTGFLSSIGTGNKARGTYLASDALWNQFQGYQSFPMTSRLTDMGGGFTKVELFQPNREDDHYVAFKVLSQPGGKSNAIKAGCTKLAGCSL